MLLVTLKTNIVENTHFSRFGNKTFEKSMLKTHGLVQWWVYEIITLYEYITYRNAMKSILNIDIISTSMQNIGQIPAGV